MIRCVTIRNNRYCERTRGSCSCPHNSKPSHALFLLRLCFGVLPPGLNLELDLKPWQFDLSLWSTFASRSVGNYSTSLRSSCCIGTVRFWTFFFFLMCWCVFLLQLCLLVHTLINSQMLLCTYYLRPSSWRRAARWCALWFNLRAQPEARQEPPGKIQLL